MDSAKPQKRSRRLRVCWTAPVHCDLDPAARKAIKDYVAYLILAAPARYDPANVGYRQLLNDETQFLGRRVGPTEYKGNIIREFMRLCESNHGKLCTRNLGVEQDFLRILTEPYFGVFDIENKRLVPLPQEKDKKGNIRFLPYAAVSYVWGKSANRHYKTNMRNVQKRRKSGGLASVMAQLPLALQQSIQLVHSLGIKYIWIDALCIVQDSTHSWNLNARAMHLIYGNATITLCAADGEDARDGLRALDNKLKRTQHMETCAPGVRLFLHEPPEASIEASKWNTRAWTFQERLLSRRCLIFTGGRIYFQCRSTGMCEDVFADRRGRGWSLDMVRSPLQMLSQLKRRSLWFYVHCVKLYTQRNFSEPFDILAAFSGMSELMEYTMKCPFLFGLPTSHFDFALLWQPVGRSSRLVKPVHTKEPKYKEMKFPSWSWSGWASNGMAYRPEMVGGCLEDVHEWLLDHTWIDWRIRDGQGTLKRVWGQRQSRRKRPSDEDDTQQPRWRGYGRAMEVETGSIAPSIENQQSSDSELDRRERSVRTEISRERANTLASLESRTRHDRVNPIDVTRDMRRRENRFTMPRVRSDGIMGSPVADPLYDEYGRHRDAPGRTTVRSVSADAEFSLTLPEDPYNVPVDGTFRARGTVQKFPDQIFLQFFSWRASFRVVPADVTPSGHCVSDHEEVEEGLARFDIIDRRGDKCGSILLDPEWFARQKKPLDDFNPRRTEFDFVAISDAKSFTAAEFPHWGYYIPSEREESEWDLFYVLLVEGSPFEGFCRRVGLGKVFKAAFDQSRAEWREIILG
ncbi:heterokaryon incompatibility protein-domain-containing protein [Lasiosphaeria ovina]|uniref:Heterokaryon incompatibility protein-domain-containing protein n=1 Tax=Lasiosphaeria ovina TaxID=92902 RepID=A0AAE0K625_9PEZI|nr:heterokaryon incompatibility protein-domain-containing protein [Lasiosphaeria ovina]